MRIYSLVPKTIAYKSFRKYGRPKIKPFNLTISITKECNSRCKICNIWKEKGKKDLTLEGWKKILKSVGKSAVWITISGGEPFIRDDLVKIIRLISKYNKPSILNIATNGILTDKIASDVKNILEFYNGKLIINISFDGVKEKHDSIRGMKCFSNALKTYKKLKELKSKNNLFIGVHTVISKYNVKQIPEICDFFDKLNPDSHIFEIAENRKELKNINMDIAPKEKDYIKAINYITEHQNKKKQEKTRSISKITQFLRKKYYNYAKEILKKRKQIIPCYAGIASGHINFNGDLWACCMKCETLANLTQNDFGDGWFNKTADKIRSRIKNDKCHCTLANASYSNIICELIWKS